MENDKDDPGGHSSSNLSRINKRSSRVHYTDFCNNLQSYNVISIFKKRLGKIWIFIGFFKSAIVCNIGVLVRGMGIFYPQSDLFGHFLDRI